MIITERRCAARSMTARCTLAIALAFAALSVSQAVQAGTTEPRPVPINRDHRGDKGTTQYVRSGLKPPGARRDPGWSNYGGKKGSDVTVRDHRH